MWRQLRASLDEDSPKDRTFAEYHPQIKILLALNGIFFNNQGSLIRFICPFISFTVAVIGIIMMSLVIPHAYETGQLATAIECSAYFLDVSIVILCIPLTVVVRNSFCLIIQQMEADFQFVNSEQGAMFRDEFYQRQLFIRRVTAAWGVIMLVIVIAFNSKTALELLYQNTLAEYSESRVQPFIFPLWVSWFDVTVTPYYEIFLFIEFVATIAVGITFGSYLCLFVHFLLHGECLLNLSLFGIKLLFVGLDLTAEDQNILEVRKILRSRIGNIVRFHSNAIWISRKIMEIYNPLISYIQLIISPSVCFVLYQVAEDLEHGKLNILPVLLGGVSVAQVWVVCYLGTHLQHKTLALAEHCTYCGWYENLNYAQFTKTDLTIIITMSNQQLVLSVRGASVLSLETFSTLMNKAYTYFNMLRQTG